MLEAPIISHFRHVAGVPSNTILPHSTGEPDHRSQAFTYRLTGKDTGRPDHPFRIQEPPPGYDPSLMLESKHKAHHPQSQV